MIVENRPPARTHFRFARAQVLPVVFEDRQTKTQDPVVPCLRTGRLLNCDAGEHFADAVREKFLFVAEVRVERRSANVRAVKDLL